MRRRDFLGWLAVLPFLRKLPKPTGRRMLKVKNPEDFTPYERHAVVYMGDTRGLWGNGAHYPPNAV